MTKSKPLILGIDPGTTTAVAILDALGRTLQCFSSKNPDKSQVILKVVRYGEPIAVGTDKSAVPSTVGGYARKLGAIVVSPAKDLTKVEKKSVIDKSLGNDHEQDALAAAKFAYKSIEPRLRDAANHLEKKGNIDLSAEVLRYALKHPKMNMESVFEKFSKPNKPKPTKVIRKAYVTQDHIESLRAADKYKRDLAQERTARKQDTKLLAMKVERLKKALQNSKENLNKLVRKKTVIDANQLQSKKNEVLELKKANRKLKKELKIAQKILNDPNKWVKMISLDLAPKRARQSLIQSLEEGQAIHESNPTGMGESNRKQLRSLGAYLVSSINKSSIEGVKNICIRNLKRFVKFRGSLFVDRQSFENEKKKFDLIETIVNDYRSGRQK